MSEPELPAPSSPHPRSGPAARQMTADFGALEQRVEDLQVHRIELEMQNRALSELQGSLQAAVTRYADLYDRLPIGYVTVTPQGRILEANSRAAQWLRPQRGDLVGRYFRAFLLPDDALRVSAYFDHCAHSDAEDVLETYAHADDGTTMWLQLATRRGRSPEGAVQLYVALTDITALKQSQRSLDGVSAELDAFSHAISHDLRSPLLSISTYGRVLLEDHAEGLDDEGRRIIERIRHTSQRMEETLKQLLEYSRLTRLPLVLEPICLAQTVDDLLVEHRALIQYRKARIDVERPLASVLGSRPILDQVLRNLLSNALKYTLPDEAPSVRISTTVNSTRVVLQVSDQGIGIDPKYHGHLFKLFERLNPHCQYPGAGVGLAIVRRAVERMNGRVWLRSELRKGSTFYVELPRA